MSITKRFFTFRFITTVLHVRVTKRNPLYSTAIHNKILFLFLTVTRGAFRNVTWLIQRNFLAFELCHYRFRFFAVLADCLKALLVGAPFEPGLRIFSPLPALMRFRFA